MNKNQPCVYPKWLWCLNAALHSVLRALQCSCLGTRILDYMVGRLPRQPKDWLLTLGSASWPSLLVHVVINHGPFRHIMRRAYWTVADPSEYWLYSDICLKAVSKILNSLILYLEKQISHSFFFFFFLHHTFSKSLYIPGTLLGETDNTFREFRGQWGDRVKLNNAPTQG